MDNVRVKKFLIALNDWLSSNSYYDEELEDTIIQGSEDECYNELMKCEEYHLLGTDIVKGLIHTAFISFDGYIAILKKYDIVL